MEQRQFEAMLADAEIRLKRLRSLYDQWFHGLERVEPQQQRADVDRLIAELKRDQPRNTALRFRLNQLVQRYTTYNTYWQRITRQIEEGTYKRDVLRARRRFGPQGGRRESAANGRDGYELDLDIDIEAALEATRSEPPPASSESGTAADGERPSRPARAITPFAMPTPVPAGAPAAVVPPLPAVPPMPAGITAGARVAPPSLGTAAPRPGAAAPPPAGVVAARKAAPPPPPAARANSGPVAPPPAANNNAFSDEQILNLYQKYVSARRNNRERVDNVRLETVAKTVRDMLPKLKEKHAGKQIDFEVVVKDGRVALKPVAK